MLLVQGLLAVGALEVRVVQRSGVRALATGSELVVLREIVAELPERSS